MEHSYLHTFKKVKSSFREDGTSLTWGVRFFLYTTFTLLGYLAVRYVGSQDVEQGILGIENLAPNSHILLAIFAFIFGIGHLIVKTHDVKRVARQDLEQRNATIYTTTTEVLLANGRGRGENAAVNANALKNFLALRGKIDRTQFRAVLENLNSINLSNANLRGVDLRGAHLERAVLVDAKLIGASLRGAGLFSANLKGAVLNDTDFSGADLVCANLECATLKSANLIDANLDGADLSGADLSGAILERAKLTGAKYNKSTLFPEIFNPASSGMIEI